MTDEAISACRRGLPAPAAPLHNPALAFERYLPMQGDNHKKAKALHQAIVESPAPEVYCKAFERWGRMVKAMPHTVWLTGELGGPLAVGLGGASPFENGLTTHRTYGMPVIPGSALKGLCRRASAWMCKGSEEEQKAYRALFGCSDKQSAEAGYVTFWDAWYDPASVYGKPFHRDVVTVHHQRYYTQKGRNVWPTDFDDPTPIPLLVVKPGARFFFAVTGLSDEWAQFAMRCLSHGLAHLGAGGKTNAGYGWFQIPEEKSAAQERPAFRGILWKDVTVRRDPGRRELSASFEGKKAYARGSAAEELLASLPESAQGRLTGKKKELRADIEVAPEGNSWTIRSISPKEG